MEQNGRGNMSDGDNLIREISVQTVKQPRRKAALTLFCVLLSIPILLWCRIIWSWNTMLLAIPTIAGVCVYLHSAVSKETLLMIPSLGVQISSEYLTGRRVINFIPFKNVQDIIITEAVTMHKVVYYLAVLLKHHSGEEWSNSLVPVFLHSMPRLDKLREIHASVHKVLDSEKHQLEPFGGGGDVIPNR